MPDGSREEMQGALKAFVGRWKDCTETERAEPWGDLTSITAVVRTDLNTYILYCRFENLSQRIGTFLMEVK